MQMYMISNLFYKAASVWCYKHKRFEYIIKWAEHNEIEEFQIIRKCITPNILTKRIGDIELTIILNEGLICPDVNLPKPIKNILPLLVKKTLREERIYRLCYKITRAV